MATDFIGSQTLELRRGTIVLATLCLLRSPHYGYRLLQALETIGVPVDAGTLYPLLRRLEKQGVLESSWEMSEARPRKYYRLSSQGEQQYLELAKEWMDMATIVRHLIEKEVVWN